MECAPLPEAAAPVTATCTWNDGDTAGSVAGYGVDAGRLAELASAAYASIVVERS